MVYIPGNKGHFKSKNMKHLLLLLVSPFLLSQYSFSQNEPADCRKLLDNMVKKLDAQARTIAAAGKIEDKHLSTLDAWFTELKGIADKNNFGLFAGTDAAQQNCNRNFEDIFKIFFSSGKQYVFNKRRYSTLEECTGNYADELNTPETIGRLKRLSFILHAVYPVRNFNTLNLTEKKTYTAFHNFLMSGQNATDPGIYAFFYTHIEDIKKATGIDPRRGTQDSKIFAQNFMLSFKPHLLYYFGVAEEEFAKVDAADIRTAGTATGFYRQYLHNEILDGLRLIASELNKLKEKCDPQPKDQPMGLTSTVINYRPVIKTDKAPEMPTGDAAKLKPGHGWVLLGILNANGKVYREYGDKPLVGLYVEENGKKRFVSYITSSEYQQVPAGRYYATVSMAASPQSGITVTAGAETNVALRLGRMVLDPRNFDGSASKQEIGVYAIQDEPANAGGSRLTNTVVTLLAKGGDSLDLAPGRYIVHTRYGLLQKDTIIIRSQECTKITISGAAKFTAAEEKIELRKVIPNSVPQWITFLSNGQDIQLAPGLYEIRTTTKGTYRLKMEAGQAYTYKAP